MRVSNDITVKPEKSRLTNLLEEIRKGKIVVPKFQRDYVWNTKQRLELFDSISKGFPIGSLLFWAPEESEFGYNNEIGPYKLELNSDKYSYIIDGYQRITTLFSAMTNPEEYSLSNSQRTILPEYIVYYDLENEEFIHKTKFYESPIRQIDYSIIPLFALVNTFDFLTFSKNIQEQFGEEKGNIYINRAKSLATLLVDYEVAFVNINGGSIKDAVEIFSRINSKGSDMSPMWMLSALTYDETGDGFKFSNEVDQLKSELSEFNFEELKTEIILQCIESSTGKIYFDVKTESLANRDDFKDLCMKSLTNIYKAVEFLFNYVYVTKLKLLPYNLQLIFISEFFRLIENPTSDQLKSLERWFWQTTYSSYFSIYSLSKQRKAFSQFQNWCNGNCTEILYKQSIDEQFVAPDFPSKINYGSVRSKALALFLIKYALENDICSNNFVLKDFQSLSKKSRDSGLAVPIFEEMKLDNYIQNRGDYSFLLKLKENFNPESNFINEDVKLANDNLNQLINIRKKLIVNAEKEFVNELDIIYPFNFWIFNNNIIDNYSREDDDELNFY